MPFSLENVDFLVSSKIKGLTQLSVMKVLGNKTILHTNLMKLSTENKMTMNFMYNTSQIIIV